MEVTVVLERVENLVSYQITDLCFSCIMFHCSSLMTDDANVV